MAYELKGQNIVDLVNAKLGGLANSIAPDQLLSFINEGKDELWGVLSQLKRNYFVVGSQSTNSAASYYFPSLSTSQREYALPSDLIDIVFIEVISPTGYEMIKFVRRPMFHPEFRDARTSSTAFQDQGGTIPFSGFTDYIYDIVGKGTLILAQFPEVAFTLKIWYVRALPEITLSGVVDEIVFPFHKKIADFAAMKVILKDELESFAAWVEQWKQDLIQVSESADRSSADPIYSADFLG